MVAPWEKIQGFDLLQRHKFKIARCRSIKILSMIGFLEIVDG